MGQGYVFLRLTCGCGRITDYPFPLLLQRRGVSRDSFIGNIPFKCKHCGGKQPSTLPDQSTGILDSVRSAMSKKIPSPFRQ
jgi:hypothetical protein